MRSWSSSRVWHHSRLALLFSFRLDGSRLRCPHHRRRVSYIFFLWNSMHSSLISSHVIVVYLFFSDVLCKCVYTWRSSYIERDLATDWNVLQYAIVRIRSRERSVGVHAITQCTEKRFLDIWSTSRLTDLLPAIGSSTMTINWKGKKGDDKGYFSSFTPMRLFVVLCLSPWHKVKHKDERADSSQFT